MNIGGTDLVLDGNIRADAPEFVRKIIERTWPAARVWDANIPMTDASGFAIQDKSLWKFGCELFVTPGEKLNDESPGPYLHVFLSKEQVTIVVDPSSLTLGERILRALRGRKTIAKHAMLIPPDGYDGLSTQVEFVLGSYLDQLVCTAWWAWPTKKLLPKNRAPAVAAIIESAKSQYDVHANCDHEKEADRLISMLPDELVAALRRRLTPA